MTERSLTELTSEENEGVDNETSLLNIAKSLTTPATKKEITTTIEITSADEPPKIQRIGEKALHFQYINEFRCTKCELFEKGKCKLSKPYTCFNWHFNNHRRRKPTKDLDGNFNYSPDIPCTYYNLASGVCPKGDICPYLHRNYGETERRYHPRYYKTSICVYGADKYGYCLKNGRNCAYAHGEYDKREPTYCSVNFQTIDLSSESQRADSNENENLWPQNDKTYIQTNLRNEDPRWTYTKIINCFKTEPCRDPSHPRKPNYNCPYIHEEREKRRAPSTGGYRPKACPNVKKENKYGVPSDCVEGNECTYCHTRVELQFHPEIYKTKSCKDMDYTGYCSRGQFCAFAHKIRDDPIPPTQESTIKKRNEIQSIGFGEHNYFRRSTKHKPLLTGTSKPNLTPVQSFSKPKNLPNKGQTNSDGFTSVVIPQTVEATNVKEKRKRGRPPITDPEVRMARRRQKAAEASKRRRDRLKGKDVPLRIKRREPSHTIPENMIQSSGFQLHYISFVNHCNQRLKVACLRDNPSPPPLTIGPKLEAPKIEENTLRDLTVEEGRNVKFDVKVSGNPIPSILWFYDDFRIRPSQEYKIEKQPQRSRLSFKARKKLSGIYKVVVRNESGAADAKAIVTIKKSAKSAPK